jgi:hypothetical protein
MTDEAKFFDPGPTLTGVARVLWDALMTGEDSQVPLEAKYAVLGAIHGHFSPDNSPLRLGPEAVQGMKDLYGLLLLAGIHRPAGARSMVRKWLGDVQMDLLRHDFENKN